MMLTQIAVWLYANAYFVKNCIRE